MDSIEGSSYITREESIGDSDHGAFGVTERRQFTVQQLASLNSFYKNGMQGVGRQYGVFIESACKDTGLTTEQVQRWIKKKRYRQKHAVNAQEGDTIKELPVKKKAKLSPWQCFQQEFGQSNDGKGSMTLGVGSFSKAASNAYHALSAPDKEALKECGSGTSTVRMMKKEITKLGARKFLKIQKLIKELEDLGYAAFAMGFFEEDVQFTSTQSAKCFSKPEIIEYLHALIIAGNPPSIDGLFPLSESAEEEHALSMATIMQPASNSKAIVNPPLSKSTETISLSKSVKTVPPPKSTKIISLSKSTKTIPPPKSTKTTLLPKSAKGVPSSKSAPPSRSAKSVLPLKSTKNTKSKVKQPPSKQLFSTTTSNQIPSNESSTSQHSLLDHLLNTIPIKGSSEIEATGQTVSVSDSPVKADPNEWLKLPTITLYKQDQCILESSVEWLNSNIIHAAQILIKSQFPSIFGLLAPEQGDWKQMFTAIPPATPFIQIMNIDKCHWVAVSNIDVGNHGHRCDTVSLYDSGSPARITRQTRQLICSLMKPATLELQFDLVNIMLQPNGSDCGVFSIACATELAHGFDPALCYWECEAMRSHLLHCLEAGSLTRFPCVRKRRLPLGARVKKSIKETIYCTCRTINDVSRPMIWCDMCIKCFHMDCEGLDPAQDKSAYSNKKWICSQCTKDAPSYENC